MEYKKINSRTEGLRKIKIIDNDLRTAIVTDKQNLDSRRKKAIKEQTDERQKELYIIDKKCKDDKYANARMLKEIDEKWDKLKRERTEFDRFEKECQTKIDELTKLKEYEKQYTKKLTMPERCVLQLFEIAPYLKSEARDTSNYAAVMAEKLKAFSDVVNPHNDTSCCGLSLKDAMDDYEGARYLLLLDGLVEQSFEYYNDVSCKNDKEFDALVLPAVEECFKQSEKLRKKYATDFQKQRLIKSFREWCVENDDIKIGQESLLENARENLLRIVPGCDKFCLQLYHKIIEVDGVLDSHARNMRMCGHHASRSDVINGFL